MIVSAPWRVVQLVNWPQDLYQPEFTIYRRRICTGHVETAPWGPGVYGPIPHGGRMTGQSGDIPALWTELWLTTRLFVWPPSSRQLGVNQEALTLLLERVETFIPGIYARQLTKHGVSTNPAELGQK